MAKKDIYHEPITIARVSLFQGDLEETITRFSLNFFRKPDNGKRLVYGFLCPGDSPYIINLAHNPRELVPPENYNSLLLITSRSNERNRELLGEFQHKTGMDFKRPAPEKTELHAEVYDLMLQLLHEKPDEIAEILIQLAQQS